MINHVFMPKLTNSMNEGQVVTWRKHEGDPVQSGDLIADIETGAAVMDLEATGSGILRRVLASEGETRQVGTLLAIISELDEDIEPLLGNLGMSNQSTSETLPPPKGAKASQTSPVLTTNSASMENIPPEVLRSGAEIYVLKPSAPPPPKKMGKANFTSVSDTTTEWSPSTITPLESVPSSPVPHFYLTTEIMMDEALRLREQANQIQRDPLSLTSLFVRAAALSLKKYPAMNVTLKGKEICLNEHVDIGQAVALDNRVVSPVVKDCVSKNLSQITKEARALLQQTRNQQVKSEEVGEASFFIFNLGMYGVENFMAVLTPPHAAALAIGAVRTVPVVQGNTVGIGKRMRVTLSCDHRAIHTAQAARFLQGFKEILEKPLALFLALG
jgi:pyruvate dehydrogenase E2 component (dihydrolipoamide acetyltransferase)